MPIHRRAMHVVVMAVFVMAVWSVSPCAVAEDRTADVSPTITGPLTVADAVRTAIEHSPVVEAAQARARGAESRVGAARAMAQPQLSLTGVAATATMSSVIASPPNIAPSGALLLPNRNSTVGQLMLMFPLYTGGRISAEVRGARALSLATSSDRNTVEREIAFAVKQAYYQAVYAQAVTEVYREMVTERRERVRIAEAAFDVGSIAKYDLLRNQADLAASEQDLANGDRDALIALIDLKTLMGIAQESDFTLADGLIYAPTDRDLNASLETARRNRPEIAAADLRVLASRSDVDAAKSAYRPQVYIVGMQGSMSTSDESDSGNTLGIAAGLPLLDGGLRRSQVRSAESMLDAARSDARQTRLLIEQDVRTAWAELTAAEKSVKLSEVAVVQSEEDYRVIKLRYEAGKALNVEVLDALATLTQSRTNHLAALAQYATATAHLDRAIGAM